MSFYLIEVEVGDIEGLASEADVNSAFLPQRYEPDFKVVPFLREFRNTEGFRVFALTENGHEFFSFIAILPAKDKSVMYIGPMYVAKQYQGRGFGRLQVEELIRWGKDKGYKKVHTKTWGGNIRSRSIFKSLGFNVFEELLDQRINGDSSIKFKLEL